MDERHYITVEEEKAQQAKTAQPEGYADFLSQWRIDSIPACDAGMRLLYEFATSQPASFAWLMPRGFIADEPRMKNSAQWRAFSDHMRTCPNCNEAGDYREDVG